MEELIQRVRRIQSAGLSLPETIEYLLDAGVASKEDIFLAYHAAKILNEDAERAYDHENPRFG